MWRRSARHGVCAGCDLEWVHGSQRVVGRSSAAAPRIGVGCADVLAVRRWGHLECSRFYHACTPGQVYLDREQSSLSAGTRALAPGANVSVPRDTCACPRCKRLGPRCKRLCPRCKRLGPRCKRLGPRCKRLGPRVQTSLSRGTDYPAPGTVAVVLGDRLCCRVGRHLRPMDRPYVRRRQSPSTHGTGSVDLGRAKSRPRAAPHRSVSVEALRGS